VDTTQYMATVNTPGYLPMDDDPPVFDTASEAWAHHANAREGHEGDMSDDSEYSDVVMSLRYAAGPTFYPDTAPGTEPGNPHEDVPLNADGTGVIYGPTPGYDGDHDLGLAYCVTAVFGGSVL
jgi:hypothetical protein